jgi:hypothetical protein
VGALFTGGEDSRVCSWRPSAVTTSAADGQTLHNVSESSESGVKYNGSSLKEKKKKSKSSKSDDIRYKPY